MRNLPNIALAILLVFFCACPFGVMAQNEGCNSYIPTEVDVQPEYDDVVYDYTTPMLQIRDLSEPTQEAPHGSKQSEAWPVGLSTGEMYFRVTNDVMKMRTSISQMTCGQIKAVHVEFGFKDNKIYVAKEFPKRSCPYKEILAHEEKHKAVDRKLIQEYTDKIKTVFTEASRKIGVVQAGASGVVDDQINSAFNQSVQKLTKELEAEHNARQKLVDSKEEYQRVSDSCEGQTMDIVHQRLEILEATHPGITKVKDIP